MIVWCSFLSTAKAQRILDKQISVGFSHVRLADALKEIGTQGQFYFSYNGKILPKDSLVTLVAKAEPVSSILEKLFHQQYEFEEQQNYLIITQVFPHLSIINTDIINDNHSYSISGLVLDERNGERLANVSVYEKQQLVATLTDEHGYFRLKIRSANPVMLSITASKIRYKDASLNFLQSVAITDRTRMRDDQQVSGGRKGVERDALGRFFISARQRVQSLNIPDFFAKRPFQFSLTPGLSTHGLFSSQVVNKFSVNLVGGYTAGVNGMEIGGLFNMNKGDSKYLQLAGVFNLVGGTVTGLQLAGITNRALDTVKGVQLAGFINKNEGQVSGLQIAALNNEAHQLKGVQIGLVNVVDTSKGVSIGLINIIHNGFYRIGLSANSILKTNLSFTTGTHLFYTTVHVGMDIRSGGNQYALGLGLGHDFMFNERLFLSASVDYQQTGVHTLMDHWKQGKLLLNYQLSKHLSVFAGPLYQVYAKKALYTNMNQYFDPSTNTYNYNGDIPKVKERTLSWEAGIAFNSVFKPAAKVKFSSDSWYLGVTGITGVDIKANETIAGGELFAQRDFSGSVAATLSVGYIQRLAKDTYIPALTPGTQYLSYMREMDFKSLPIKAGMRTYTSKRLFFSGELGGVIGLNQPRYGVEIKSDGTTTIIRDTYKPSAFLAGASVGYDFDRGFEAGLRYDDYFGLDMQLVTLRLAYRIKFGKR